MTTTAADTPPTISGLRSLYLGRVAFSVVWVVLVFATSTSQRSTDGLTAIAAVLLVVYPLWDVVATLLEHRLTGAASLSRVAAINLAVGLVATVAMIVAVFSSLEHAVLVFGIWALLAGVIQVVVALGRRRALGLQWPMIVSGVISAFAGVSFAAGSGSVTDGLVHQGGYSAFGAFWFLVAVVTLSVRARRSSGGGRRAVVASGGGQA